MRTRVVNRRKERFDVYIGRPSIWGNPFSHLPHSASKWKVATKEEAIEKFREWFLSQPALVERARRQLKGKVLGCWCKPGACHGDVIAEIVDGEVGCRGFKDSRSHAGDAGHRQAAVRRPLRGDRRDLAPRAGWRPADTSNAPA